MALSENQQFEKSIAQSKHILILFNSKDNGDAAAAAIALKIFLEKKHKQTDVVCPNFLAPKNLKFLPEINTIQSELQHLQKFIIRVDVSKNPIETLSYDIKDGTLSIYLTPKQGLISKHDLRTAQSTFKYDLIVTLSTADLDSLGPIYFNNTDLFYRTTIVNIDYQANNERYGQINLVDLTATSVSEIIYKTLKGMEETAIEPTLATTLLTGMTIATKSFKSPHITPITLQIASQLINSGAEREKIVQNLYRTKSIATLRLWGEALTHLQNNQQLGLVWTTITRDDFARSGGSHEELQGIIEELISNSPEAKVTMLLYELNNGEKGVRGIVTVEKQHDALKILQKLNPEGSKRHASFTIQNKTLKEAEENVLEILKQNLSPQ